jgi:hypothetical protein
LEVLDRSACLARLARGGVGRIAFVDDDATVAILPVNFALHDEEILISTGRGSAIHRRAESGSLAGFEIDETDPNYHGGRSVLVRGVLHIVGPQGGAGGMGRPPAWGNRGADVVVALSIDQVTGRRIPPLPPRAHPELT